MVLLAKQEFLVEYNNALYVVVNTWKVVLGSSRGFLARKQRRHRRASAPVQSYQHLRRPLTGKFVQIYNIYNFNTSDQHLRHSLTGNFIQIYNINNFYILESLQVYAAWADWFEHDLVTNPKDIFSHDLIHSDSMTSN